MRDRHEGDVGIRLRWEEVHVGMKRKIDRKRGSKREKDRARERSTLYQTARKSLVYLIFGFSAGHVNAIFERSTKRVNSATF